MPQTRLDELLARLNSLQGELESELERIYEEKRESFQYTLKKVKCILKSRFAHYSANIKKAWLNLLLMLN